MAHRRVAIAAVAIMVAIGAPACRFSRSSSDEDAAATSTTAETLALFGDDTSTTTGETTTTIESASTSTTRKVATTVRSGAASTRAPAPRAAPPPTAGPHCTVGVADTFYGSSWTAYVSSTFPSAGVTIDIRWPGGSGNYSGYTDPAGSWTKTQRVQPSMRGQRVSVSVAVASVRCSTSFTVS